uniref:Putative heptaprenyl diphosphate synthase component I n=1 Tax=Magnetococcus massalia (strain MO-1) TaxID=451514 RepID=A0A1S7LLT2_MAGMO|nr:putative heptaprenyl diphosphate synthase component I [Candidatus Magnetococcus massalia]
MSHAATLRRDLLIGYLSVAAVAAHVLEANLPGLGPWFKPGLANIFTVVAFFHLDRFAAVAVTLIRVLGASIAMGTLLSPTFMLSLSGATGTVMVMLIVPLLLPGIGPVGLSILMALAHMSMQLWVAQLLFIQHAGLFLIMPWFLLAAWLTGGINGLIAYGLMQRLKQRRDLQPL